MEYAEALTSGVLVKRYKRFLADIVLDTGEEVTAHCANSGTMMGCAEPGMTVYVSANKNPKAKLDWRWELVDVGTSLVGINTSRTNAVAEAAIEAGVVSELTGYTSMRREVKYAGRSRIDILLEDPGLCFVEVKNVTLAVPPLARFPDAVTARGAKHLEDLAGEVAAGNRAVMLYVINRSDCTRFEPADDIDPVYAQGLKRAMDVGVEAIAYSCDVTLDAIRLAKPVAITL